MTAQIHIPEPCTAGWEEMTPTDNGRHCAQCCKTVVDFTSWETEEIVAYLQAHAGQKICGRVIADQISIKEPTRKQQLKAIWRSASPVYKKIAAVIILFFSIENMTYAQAKPRQVPKVQQHGQAHDPVIMGGIPAPAKRDTPVHKREVMGKMRPKPAPKAPVKKPVPKPPVKEPLIEEQVEVTQGKMEMVMPVLPPTPKTPDTTQPKTPEIRQERIIKQGDIHLAIPAVRKGGSR